MMIKHYFAFIIILVCSTLTAQTIIFTDAVFKAKLLQSEASSTIARNLSDDYFAIDVNNNGEIEISEALQVGHLEIENSSITSLIGIENFKNLISLRCSNNKISDLNVSNLTVLKDLICDNNTLTNLTVLGASNLQNLYCQSNKLTILNANDLVNLLTLNCSDNNLTTVNLDNLINLESFFCNSNSISILDLSDLINLLTLECSRNVLSSLDLSLLTNITSLNCNFNQLSVLDATTLHDLANLNCTNNQLTTLKIEGLAFLSNLNCNYNLLTALNTNTLTALTYLYCNNNNLLSLQVTGIMNLRVLDFSKNQITAIDTNGLTNLQYLYCNYNKLVTLDVTNQIKLQFLLVSNNLLTSIYMKNGSNESSLLFSGNPNLNYICVDESEIEYVQEEILNNGYTNCFVNSYCTFVPGGNYFTIEGVNKLDNNNNGCDVLDGYFPSLKFSVNDETTSTTFISDSTGNYSHAVKEGSYTIVPVLENPTYYTISPSSVDVNFPDSTTPFSTSFCITPNGIHKDLEIMFLPMDNARSNFESVYKIIYRNKGNIEQSGAVNLTFDATALSLVTENPLVSSQSSSVLNWNFLNLQPQESRTILVTMKVKLSATNGYLLNFNASITSTSDEIPEDNSADLNQTVVSSINFNDKICLDGKTISPIEVGDYLYYMIRFENSGSAVVQNIVVKDLIDTSKFNIATLVSLNGSHPFTTKIAADNNVEFIFQNINLPFDSGNNRGYVVFKIKTIPTLIIGNEITNSATIYFDYNQLLATNIARTSIQALQIQENIFTDFFAIYPNPVADVLNIINKNQLEINSIEIYNAQGQIVQTIISKENTGSITVSQLKAGLYFIKINSDTGTATYRFLKK